MKKILLPIAGFAVGTVVAVLLFEGLFRLLPVVTGLRALPVSAAQPVFRFTPDREYVWSIGWNFAIVNRGRSNNAGFINHQDYDPDDPRPLIAVVGDSYVEAMMVPYESTLQGRLAKALAPDVRVYSFAASGGPLSQYLVWAEHACEHYGPGAMVFVVIGNDFDESLAAYKRGPGFHHFVDDGGGGLRLQRIDYSPATLRKLLRSSALARYLVFNLHIEETLRRVWPGAAAGPVEGKFVANTLAYADERRVMLSRRAVDAFFSELPARCGLPPERVLFVLDGFRPALYRGEAALAAARTSFAGLMMGYFSERAADLGYATIDMNEPFLAHYAENGERFEFETDAHWNELGHEVAADTVAEEPVVRALARRAAGGLVTSPSPTPLGESISRP